MNDDNGEGNTNASPSQRIVMIMTSVGPSSFDSNTFLELTQRKISLVGKLSEKLENHLPLIRWKKPNRWI